MDKDNHRVDVVFNAQTMGGFDLAGIRFHIDAMFRAAPNCGTTTKYRAILQAIIASSTTFITLAKRKKLRSELAPTDAL